LLASSSCPRRRPTNHRQTSNTKVQGIDDPENFRWRHSRICRRAISYSVDTSQEKSAGAPPEAFLLDEAFRYIYADDTIDFGNLKNTTFRK